VCWTPRYFTRLWCIYEIVTWLHLKPASTLRVLPVSQSMVSVICIPIVSFYHILRAVLGPVFGQGITLILAWVGISIYAVGVQKLVQELSLFASQLKTFSIQSSECFCCSTNHVATASATPLQCDRQLVYDKLTEWKCGDRSKSEASADDEQMALIEFNEVTQSMLTQHVLPRVGPTHIPYSSIMVAVQPVFWFAFDVLAATGTIHLVPLMRKVIEIVAVGMMVFPVYSKILFKLLLAINRRWTSHSHPVFAILVTLLRVILSAVLLFVVWRPVIELNKLESIVPIVSLNSLLLLATMYFYKRNVY